ncbi:MAG: hypothetical protein K2N14_03405 [Clostridia bacterium]|nr:hypothetical protein [Clostridia bacterium]
MNEEVLPTIPVPHDCIVEEITFDKGYLVFKFGEDISDYDSIKYLNPNAKSLVIRIHCDESEPTFAVYENKWRKKFGRKGYYLINNKKLPDLCKNTVEYLYHYVGFQSILIRLYRDSAYMLFDVDADYVEFEWIEK